MKRMIGLAKMVSVILAMVVSGCGPADAELVQSPSSRQDPFGIITHQSIRQWSALWHMHQNGSIAFCIRNARNSNDRTRVQAAAREAVTGWLQRLSGNPPDSSYPNWTRRDVSVTFGCSGDVYTIALFSGRSNCEFDRQRVNLGYDTPNVVFVHEFGHSMGLADTYRYGGGFLPNQPESMMREGRRFTGDDRKAIWALWRYLKTGELDCGPGYTTSPDGNYAHDWMCKPGGGGECEYPCNNEGRCENGWLCKDSCWERVNSCSTDECEYPCRREGRCENGWLCRDLCWERVSSCPGDCQYRCRDYGYAEGQCYQGWRCSDGCLNYVGRC